MWTGVFRKYDVSSSYLPIAERMFIVSGFRKYDVSSSYLPYLGLPAMMLSFGSMAFRAATYRNPYSTPRSASFAGMEFRAVTYQETAV